MTARLFLKQGDITEMDVDAIINSANNDLILGSGVSGAIRRIGGPQIQEECNRFGTIPLGEAVITTAGNLRCRSIIHAAVMPLGLWAESRSVRQATQKAIKIAIEKGMKKIALPAIGTGAGALPIDRCAEILIQEALATGKQNSSLEEIWFVLYDEKTYQAFEEKMRELCPEALPPSTPSAASPSATPEPSGAPNPPMTPPLSGEGS